MGYPPGGGSRAIGTVPPTTTMSLFSVVYAEAAPRDRRSSSQRVLTLVDRSPSARQPPASASGTTAPRFRCFYARALKTLGTCLPRPRTRGNTNWRVAPRRRRICDALQA